MREPFRFSNGQIAYNVEDLVGICHQSPHEGIYFLKRGDFENWLIYIGETQLAQQAQKIRQGSLSGEEQLKQFLKNCQFQPLPTLSPNLSTTNLLLRGLQVFKTLFRASIQR